LKNRLAIPVHIHCSIYYKNEPLAIDKDESLNEGLASRIINLKQNDTRLTNTAIAAMVGCSRQYVSNVLNKM
jgi:hypothetical protein